MRGVYLLACWLALPVVAQEPVVSVTADGDSVRAVFEVLARETGRPILLDPRILPEPITLNLIDQPLDAVLELICRRMGLVWYEEEGTLFVSLDPAQRAEIVDLGDVPTAALLYPPSLLARPVTLSLSEVPVRDAVAALAEPTGASLEVDPGVPYDIRISATFERTPLSRCLYMLCVTSGLFVRPDEQMRLRLHSPVRVSATRADRDGASVIEHWPADYRGALGYLLGDRFWADPSRYRTEVSLDGYRQPRLVAVPAESPSG